MSDSYISFFEKCWQFLSYVINFLRGRKQDEINKANTVLENDYNEIDKDKEKEKQDDTQNRLNNLFK